MTGTAVAQAIPIAISPILTRLYTPSDFGVFALFFSIVAILGTVVNGRYELAIMLPKKDEDAINIFALGFIINCIISFAILLIILIFNRQITNMLGNSDISLWLYFVPLTLFFMGIFNVLNYFNTRQKNYEDIATANIYKSIVLAVVQLGIGFIKQGVVGLISGQIISQMFANMRLAKNIFKDKILISKISIAKMVVLGKKYRDFPKILMISHAINTISGQILVIMVPLFFGFYELGLIVLAQRVISAPISIISKSISQVFFQEASLLYLKQGGCLPLFKTTIKSLFFMSFVMSVIIWFLAYAIPFVFGQSWEPLIVYVHILIPMYFFSFIDSPLSLMFMVAQQQKMDLIWQVYLIITLICSLIVGRYLGGIVGSLAIYSITYSLAYVINIIICFKFSKGYKYGRR